MLGLGAAFFFATTTPFSPAFAFAGAALVDEVEVFGFDGALVIGVNNGGAAAAESRAAIALYVKRD